MRHEIHAKFINRKGVNMKKYSLTTIMIILFLGIGSSSYAWLINKDAYQSFASPQDNFEIVLSGDWRSISTVDVINPFTGGGVNMSYNPGPPPTTTFSFYGDPISQNLSYQEHFGLGYGSSENHALIKNLYWTRGDTISIVPSGSSSYDFDEITMVMLVNISNQSEATTVVKQVSYIISPIEIPLDSMNRQYFPPESLTTSGLPDSIILNPGDSAIFSIPAVNPTDYVMVFQSVRFASPPPGGYALDVGEWLQISAADAIRDTIPPEPPNLISPPDGSSTSNPTPELVWNSVPGAVAYEPQIDQRIGDVPLPFLSWEIEPGIAHATIKYAPANTCSISITRSYVTHDHVIPLDSLTWAGTDSLPWTPVPGDPIVLAPGDSATHDISLTGTEAAVLMRYMAESPSSRERYVEVISQSDPPAPIDQFCWLSNWYAYNLTSDTANNYELYIYGDIDASDIGEIYVEWGTSVSKWNIAGGIKLRWYAPDDPILPDDWRHFGLTIEVSAGIDSVLSYYTKQVYGGTQIPDCEWVPMEAFDVATYDWTVAAIDQAGNYSEFAIPWSFTIVPLIPGWAQKESIPKAPDIKAGKYVKDGGSMVAVGADLYMFPGNKSWQFYKYNTYTGVYTTLESIPYGKKPTNPLKINKKKIGKGAALCYDDSTHIIYATKGNGTKEFWSYNISGNTWKAESFVPVPKALKAGTQMDYYEGKIYLLAGGQKKTDPNYYIYDVYASTWDTAANRSPLFKNKPHKEKTLMTLIKMPSLTKEAGDGFNSTVTEYYDNYHHEWRYYVNNHCKQYDNPYCPYCHWSLGEGYVDPNPYPPVAMRAGAAIASVANRAWLTLGGGKQNFVEMTALNESTYTFASLETVPRLHKKSVPKTGAAMAYANGAVWLMKGNNTPELWRYTPSEEVMERVNSSNITSVMTKTNLTSLKFSLDIIPNPFTKLTTIKYTVPIAGKVTIKLYNVTGQVVKTINDGYLNIGTYTTNLSAKSFAKGVYFLRYSDNTNQKEIKLSVE